MVLEVKIRRSKNKRKAQLGRQSVWVVSVINAGPVRVLVGHKRKGRVPGLVQQLPTFGTSDKTKLLYCVSKGREGGREGGVGRGGVQAALAASSPQQHLIPSVINASDTSGRQTGKYTARHSLGSEVNNGERKEIAKGTSRGGLRAPGCSLKFTLSISWSLQSRSPEPLIQLAALFICREPFTGHTTSARFSSIFPARGLTEMDPSGQCPSPDGQQDTQYVMKPDYWTS
ncbi:hypothetical protein RRG08_022406 [Elysia crispata]|uniref:Uncharacterized protein n=1 Tax=Elysia crispata TaxID=231223 RepID=A0AAE0Z145_9GAST|nr:hypothetical protein RRG08_022406 [Elysia crispata]